MNRLRHGLARLSIRWKMTFWAAALMCILFLAYNAIQYIVINNWMFGRTESAALKSAEEIRSYFEIEKVTEESVGSIGPFIDSLNSSNQMIRILNRGQSRPDRLRQTAGRLDSAAEVRQHRILYRVARR